MLAQSPSETDIAVSSPAESAGSGQQSIWRRAFERGLILPLVLAAIALVAIPALPVATQLKATLWLSFGIAALSLNFVWGKAGIFSFGQTVLFGIGAYAYAIVSINAYPVTHETISALLAAMLTSAAFAGLLGYVLFYGKVGEVYLAIVTMAVTLVFYTVVSSTSGPEYRIGEALLGGFNGMPSLPTLAIGWPGSEDSIELGAGGLLGFVACAAALSYGILQILSTGSFGRSLSGLRENESRMDLLGYDTCRLKLVAYMVGGAVAGLGGALFAAWGTFVNPSVFSLSQAAMLVIWVMVGGRGSLSGAFVGVILVQWISDEADHFVSEQTPLILGVLLITVVMLAPAGVVPLLRRALGLLRPRPSNVWTSPPLAGLTERVGHAPESLAKSKPSLRAVEIFKHFGGQKVLLGISIAFDGPGVHVVIGANGAGKSTLLAVLTGRYRANAGKVWLGDRDLSDAPTFKRARHGMGIKLQVASVFQELTVRDNLELAIRGHQPAQQLLPTLESVRLTQKLETLVSELSHGEQQWLEIAMVLAQNPPVILLDEPAAGMTSEERKRTADLIRQLGANHMVVVVEHDMSFIRSLAAPISMLHQGTVYRHGSFDEISRDSEVIDVYLGRQHAARS
jgi:branched-chain amino acid transport system permease protein